MKNLKILSIDKKLSLQRARNFFLTVIILFVTSLQVLGQAKLGYLSDIQVSLHYTHYEKNSTDNLSGLGLDGRVGFSLLGSLFFKESKFMIGDHIGAGFNLGGAKKPTGTPTSPTTSDPFMVSLNVQLGIKAAYAFNDDFEVGVNYMLGAGDIFLDTDSFTLGLGPAIIPSVRVGPLMGSVGFGKAVVNSNKGNFTMLEGRWLFRESKRRNFIYLFFRYENYTGKASDFTQKGQQALAGIGFM